MAAVSSRPPSRSRVERRPKMGARMDRPPPAPPGTSRPGPAPSPARPGHSPGTGSRLARRRAAGRPPSPSPPAAADPVLLSAPRAAGRRARPPRPPLPDPLRGRRRRRRWRRPALVLTPARPHGQLDHALLHGEAEPDGRRKEKEQGWRAPAGRPRRRRPRAPAPPAPVRRASAGGARAGRPGNGRSRATRPPPPRDHLRAPAGRRGPCPPAVHGGRLRPAVARAAEVQPTHRRRGRRGRSLLPRETLATPPCPWWPHLTPCLDATVRAGQAAPRGMASRVEGRMTRAAGCGQQHPHVGTRRPGTLAGQAFLDPTIGARYDELRELDDLASDPTPQARAPAHRGGRVWGRVRVPRHRPGVGRTLCATAPRGFPAARDEAGPGGRAPAGRAVARLRSRPSAVAHLAHLRRRRAGAPASARPVLPQLAPGRRRGLPEVFGPCRTARAPLA